MLQTKLENQAFQTFLEQYFQQICKEDALKKVREKAWLLFHEVGLPTKDNEVFRYVRNLRTLFSQNYAISEASSISVKDINKHVYPECEKSLIVFVNGHFSPALSNTSALPEKVSISTLSDASRTFSAYLNNYWQRLLKEEEDPFAVINTALHGNGIFIYIPPKTQIETPIQILHIVDAKQPMLIMPRIHVFMGSQASANISFSQAHLSGSGCCINQVIDAHLDDGSRLQIHQSNVHTDSNVWHLEALRAFLKRDCWLNTVNVTNGSHTTRHDYKVVLAGENSETFLNGLWMLSGKRECHTNVLIEHQAPHCRSNQLFKGILADLGHSSFEGKIYVHQAAQKTEAFQLNNNLLLNDRAMAYSKPNLEIFADDVKASHGATIGQLDSEQLFYLKTRGIEDEEAKNLLVYGFCEEILDKIMLPSLHQNLSDFAKGYLK